MSLHRVCIQITLYHVITIFLLGCNNFSTVGRDRIILGVQNSKVNKTSKLNKTTTFMLLYYTKNVHNMVLRRILGPKRDEIECWRKIHNELHKLNPSTNIIRMIK
jgi:hypothetical protein